MGSDTFQNLWEAFQQLDVEIVVHRNPGDLGSSFEPDTNMLTWDPDAGLLIDGGVSSPASALAHEIAHAIRYHEDPEQFLEDQRVPLITTPQGNAAFGTSVEETRATEVEKVVGAELGEPPRINYYDGSQLLDGPNTNILVNEPTFSCFAGNPDCDAVIEASQ